MFLRHARQAAIVILLISPLPALAAEKQDLRLARVALFSSGVGFFERAADVTGDADAELAFRTDQINDILKSLIVRDLDGGTVGMVGYAARDPIEKTLRSFGVDITGHPTLGQLLDQLRGEPVEISGTRSVSGVILGVEKQRVVVDKTIVETEMLNVLTDAGIQQLKLGELQGIKLANPKIAAELRKALQTLSTGHDADKKSVELHFNGQGKRRVRAAYLLEAPIWKTSYRLALTADKKPFLQGWATVENATEEDWKDVKLSLVSGRPISFIMDLYTPLYVPRPTEQLELYASLRPPQLEAGYADGKAGMAMAMAAPAAAPLRSGGGVRRAAGAPGEVMDKLADGRMELNGSGVVAAASGRETGELFEYPITAPVTIARQHSAMLPIINADAAGEKLSIFNPATHPKHPLNGLYFENNSDLHLMQGPITVFDDDTYAGDAKLPDMNPGEKRLLAYALDLAVDVITERRSTPDEIVSLRIAKGVLWHRHKYVDDRTYAMHNKSKKDRTVLVEQAYTPDWSLVEPKEAFEKTAGVLRFKTAVAAGKKATLKVTLERLTDESVALTNLGSDSIELFMRSRVMSPAVKAAMEKVIRLRSDMDQATRLRAMTEQQLNEAVQDEARIRTNLQAFAQGSDEHQKQAKKFGEIDARIDALREQLKQNRTQEEQKRSALENYLLSLDVG